MRIIIYSILFLLLSLNKGNADIYKCIESAKNFLRGELARRLQMRRAPEIVFKLDKGMTKGTEVLNLLDELEIQRKQKNYLSEEI